MSDKFGLTSLETLLGADDAQSMSVEQLISFYNHPFKVNDDSEMKALIESIEENGVLTPVLIREATSAHNEPKLYEIISGHRRVYAARMAGLKEVPVVIKKMTDEEAVIAMVDSNMQRENILPSERAYSLKMKYDAMKKQGKRSDLTLDHFEPKLSSKELGEVFDMSAAQIKRYIKITDLIPGLMDYMDTKYINLAVGYALSFIDEDSQMVIYNYLQKGNKLNSKQANNLKVYNEGGTPIKEGEVEVLISDPKPKRQFKLSSEKIKEYFPDSMSEKDIESIIMDLLEKWKNGREDGSNNNDF